MHGPRGCRPALPTPAAVEPLETHRAPACQQASQTGQRAPTVGSLVPPQEALVREGRAHQRQLRALPHVWDDPLQGGPQAARPLLLLIPGERGEAEEARWRLAAGRGGGVPVLCSRGRAAAAGHPRPAASKQSLLAVGGRNLQAVVGCWTASLINYFNQSINLSFTLRAAYSGVPRCTPSQTSYGSLPAAGAWETGGMV